jgi:phage head maturation protease
MQRKIFDIKALDVDKSSGFVRVAFAQMGKIDRDNDVFDNDAFRKSIAERGPQGSNEIWHLADHERKLRASLGKFSNVYTDNNYLIGENKSRPEMWLWREVAWPLYEKGDITQHSIGFATIRQKAERTYNLIQEAAVYEGSAVLWGAQPDTPTLDVVKSFMEGKTESAKDYMAWIVKNLQEGKYSGENESLLILELKELSNLFLPGETSQGIVEPGETSQSDADKLKQAINYLSIKHFS